MESKGAPPATSAGGPRGDAGPGEDETRFDRRAAERSSAVVVNDQVRRGRDLQRKATTVDRDTHVELATLARTPHPTSA